MPIYISINDPYDVHMPVTTKIKGI